MDKIDRIANKIAKDDVLEALQNAEFLLNELRLNGELRANDMRDIDKYHKQIQRAIKAYVGR